MDDQQMERMLDELSKTRTLNLFERMAFTEALIDMDMTAAAKLLSKAFMSHGHVNAAVINNMRGRGDANSAAIAAWDYVCDHILEGPQAELYWRQREPVPAECFTDPVAYEAFRKTGKFIRSESAEYARRKFLAAYKAASTPAGPALDAGAAMQPQIGQA